MAYIRSNGLFMQFGVSFFLISTHPPPMHDFHNTSQAQAHTLLNLEASSRALAAAARKAAMSSSAVAYKPVRRTAPDGRGGVKATVVDAVSDKMVARQTLMVVSQGKGR